MALPVVARVHPVAALVTPLGRAPHAPRRALRAPRRGVSEPPSVACVAGVGRCAAQRAPGDGALCTSAVGWPTDTGAVDEGVAALALPAPGGRLARLAVVGAGEALRAVLQEEPLVALGARAC